MDAFFGHLDINTVMIAVVAVILGVQQVRNGSSKLASETVQAYKDQLEITEKRYQTQQELINSQSGQIGELKGLISGKEAQLADYRQILENRNPNLEKILNQLVHFMETIDARLSAISEHQNKPIVAETTITKQ